MLVKFMALLDAGGSKLLTSDLDAPLANYTSYVMTFVTNWC